MKICIIKQMASQLLREDLSRLGERLAAVALAESLRAHLENYGMPDEFDPDCKILADKVNSAILDALEDACKEARLQMSEGKEG